MTHHSIKYPIGGFTHVSFLKYVLSGSLAQLVEQLTFNQLVDGSNPS
jgi:hypothetical protein